MDAGTTGRRARSRWLLSALALAGASIAVLVQAVLFAHGSIDNDDAVYLLQARLIAAGHFTLSVPAPHAAYQPWFFALGPHGLVPKYLPVVSGLLGASLWLTGSVLPAMALVGALVPVLMHGLASEFVSPRRSLLVVALVGLSPLAVLQSGLVLSYYPFLVALLALWWLLVRAQRDRSWFPALVLAGLLGVVAAAMRPLDALLLTAVPLLLLARMARLRGELVRVTTGLATGVVPAAGLVLAYNAYATGRALQLPFGMLEASDRLGFGVHKLYPEDAAHAFGLDEAVQGFAQHFLASPLTWFLGGLVLIPVALLQLRHARALPAGLRSIAVSGGLFLLVYFFFWGPWNASELWFGTRLVGPFYALPLLPVIALLALSPFHRPLVRWRRPLAALVVVAVLVSAVQLASAVRLARRDAHLTNELLQVAAAASARFEQVRFDTDPAYLGHPVGSLSNPVGPGALAALVLSPYAPLPTSTDQPPGLLQIPGDVYLPGAPVRYALTTERLVAAPVLSLHVALQANGMATEHLRVGTGGLVVDYAGRRRLCAAGPQDADLAVSATGSVSCTPMAGHYPMPKLEAPSRRTSGGLTLTFVTLRPQQLHARFAGRRVLPVQVGVGQLSTLVDGAVVAQRGGGWLRVTGGR